MRELNRSNFTSRKLKGRHSLVEEEPTVESAGLAICGLSGLAKELQLVVAEVPIRTAVSSTI